MPRKQTQSKPKTSEPITQGKYWLPSDADWEGFVNLRLTDDDKAVFEVWYDSERSHIWQYLDDVMGEGMKVGLSFDRENKAYVCTLTGSGWSGGKTRLCLTTRASSLDEVLALSMFKHYQMLHEDWGNWRPKTSSSNVWG